MGEKLRELGLIKTISHESRINFIPHATSHFLGLNVHDAGEYDRPLEPGVVLTFEPGIYIPREGIGVRIEDDILITPPGNKVLTVKLPRELYFYKNFGDIYFQLPLEVILYNSADAQEPAIVQLYDPLVRV